MTLATMERSQHYDSRCNTGLSEVNMKFSFTSQLPVPQGNQNASEVNRQTETADRTGQDSSRVNVDMGHLGTCHAAHSDAVTLEWTWAATLTSSQVMQIPLQGLHYATLEKAGRPATRDAQTPSDSEPADSKVLTLSPPRGLFASPGALSLNWVIRFPPQGRASGCFVTCVSECGQSCPPCPTAKHQVRRLQNHLGSSQRVTFSLSSFKSPHLGVGRW